MTDITRLSDRSLVSYRNRLRYTQEADGGWTRKNSNSSPWSSLDGSPVTPLRSLLARDGCANTVLSDDDETTDQDVHWPGAARPPTNQQRAGGQHARCIRNSHSFSDRKSLRSKRVPMRRGYTDSSLLRSIPDIKVMAAAGRCSPSSQGVAERKSSEENSRTTPGENGHNPGQRNNRTPSLKPCHERAWRPRSSKC